MSEISKEMKLAIIEREIATCRAAVYTLSIRHRVNKKLGQTAEQLKPIEDEIVKQETAIDEFEKMEEEVKKEKDAKDS